VPARVHLAVLGFNRAHNWTLLLLLLSRLQVALFVGSARAEALAQRMRLLSYASAHPCCLRFTWLARLIAPAVACGGLGARLKLQRRLSLVRIYPNNTGGGPFRDLVESKHYLRHERRSYT